MLDADPRELGLDEEALGRLRQLALESVEVEGLPSCQLAVAVRDRVAMFDAFGEATTDSRYVIFSVTKALTAGAMWLLFGDGSLTPSTPVAEVVPEFAENGKGAVTVEQVMTHTAGFPRAPMRPLEGGDHAARLERLRSWRLDWEPGTRTEYHPSSADWVLAEVAERVAGVPLAELIASRIAGPLGLPELRLGAPPGEQDRVLDGRTIGEMSEQTRVALDAVGALATLAETGREQLMRFNDPEVRAVGVPGAGGIGTAADVARYFQALRRNDGAVWDRDVLADATGVVRNALIDPWTGVPANRTLGLRVAGDDGSAVLRGFGRGVGPRAFGSSGVGGQVAWADPDSGLSFCYLTNGLDEDPVRSFQRQAGLCAAAAACA
jgi:CubicO group peptidase (beta-lactamase class C family)